MDNNFYRPEFLYQYTTVETLALILKSRTIKFNSLINVDDMEEAKGEDVDIAGKLVFVSCWTDSKEENIALWNMYANKMKGIRIALPVYPFSVNKKSIEGQANKFNLSLIEYSHSIISLPENVCLWEDNNMDYYQLREVIYTDDEKKLFPILLKKNDENEIMLRTLELGTNKRKCWEFQQEWRYLIYLGFRFDEKIIDIQGLKAKLHKKKNYPNSLFAKIQDEKFKEMQVLLGPDTNEADEIIVQALKERYNPDMKVSKSFFREKIK